MAVSERVVDVASRLWGFLRRSSATSANSLHLSTVDIPSTDLALYVAQAPTTAKIGSCLIPTALIRAIPVNLTGATATAVLTAGNTRNCIEMPMAQNQELYIGKSASGRLYFGFDGAEATGMSIDVYLL